MGTDTCVSSCNAYLAEGIIMSDGVLFSCRLCRNQCRWQV